MPELFAAAVSCEASKPYLIIPADEIISIYQIRLNQKSLTVVQTASEVWKRYF